MPPDSARLHREVIGPDAEQLLLLTHGIFGSGANWRGIARKLHEQRPDWGIVLVDLRGHGRSDLGEPPYTLAACAADLRALCVELPAIAAIAGHSFGGKVALQTRAVAPPTVRQTWVLDASPSARPDAEFDPNNSVARVLAMMERLPAEWAKRDEFVAAVVADGHEIPFAQWLAMNIVPDDQGRYRLRLDLPALHAMLHDYYTQDLWPVAFDPALPGPLEIVIAERSQTLSAGDRARLASPPPHVHVHRIDSGHWLHIEAPANVVELLAAHLPTLLR